MKNNAFSLLLGLTVTTAFNSLPVKAASIDFDQLQLINTRPIESNYFLSFFGDQNDNQGQTAFFNSDPNAPDSGHVEISKNSPPGNIAPYYAIGRESSPLSIDSTRSTSLINTTGFDNFLNYLNDNSIHFNRIGFGYGPKSGNTFTETWNLGDDLLGQDWLASPDSTIEERIYQADPNAVESFLVLDDIKFINFDYSPFYVVFDKGETESFIDDTEVFWTNPMEVEKYSGLDPLTDGLANALLGDVNQSGNRIQLILEDSGVEDPLPIFDPNTGYVFVNIRLPLELRAVSVPEPASVLGLFLVTLLGSSLKKTSKK